jgi:hypothetical protein
MVDNQNGVAIALGGSMGTALPTGRRTRRQGSLLVHQIRTGNTPDPGGPLWATFSPRLIEGATCSSAVTDSQARSVFAGRCFLAATITQQSADHHFNRRTRNLLDRPPLNPEVVTQNQM